MIKELLPSSIAGDKNIKALAESQEGIWSFLFSEAVKTIILARLNELPEEVLDLLAWQFHIEGYEFAQDVEAKRSLVKQAIQIHQLKGTLAGIRFACEATGGNLYRVLLPSKTFLFISLSPSEKENFYSLFPELRLYRYAFPGKRYVPFSLPKQYLCETYPYTSDAETRYGYRAYLYKEGKLIPLLVQGKKESKVEKTATSVLRIHQHGKAWGYFYRPTDRFLINHGASQRIYTVINYEKYDDYSTEVRKYVISPGLEPASVRYRVVAERGKRSPKSAFIDYLQGFMTRSDAYKRIYKKYYLFDPNIEPPHSKAFCFLNHRPLRVPPYHAELLLKIRNKSPVQFCLYKFFPYQTDKSRYKATLYMLKTMKSLRDKIVIKTATKRKATADGRITAGMKILAGGEVNV